MEEFEKKHAKLIKFIGIDSLIRKRKGVIVGFVGLIVGFVRYLFCNDFSCAFSYGLTAIIIASIVYGIYNVVSKVIIENALKRAGVEDFDLDKFDFTEASEYITAETVDEKEDKK